MNELHFYYDAQGSVALVDFNGTKYSYAHNLQGDIIGILDTSGSLVVEYKYDAWGKPTATTAANTLTATLGLLNPFRYRGYIWDEDNELYYLGKRFYSCISRFISFDTLICKSYDINSVNGYAYCRNVPLITVDRTGEDLMIITASDGAAGFGHTSLLIQDEEGNWNYYYYGPVKSPGTIRKTAIRRRTA